MKGVQANNPLWQRGTGEWSAIHQRNNLPRNWGKLFPLVAAPLCWGGDLGRFAATGTVASRPVSERKSSQLFALNVDVQSEGFLNRFQ